MKQILIDNGFEKKGKVFVRNTSSSSKPELKSRIVVAFFKDGYWKASVQFYNSNGACGLGDFQYKSLKRLMTTLKKECGYCGF